MGDGRRAFRERFLRLRQSIALAECLRQLSRAVSPVRLWYLRAVKTASDSRGRFAPLGGTGKLLWVGVVVLVGQAGFVLSRAPVFSVSY